jgi:hypothetical protein
LSFINLNMGRITENFIGKVTKNKIGLLLFLELNK